MSLTITVLALQLVLEVPTFWKATQIWLLIRNANVILVDFTGGDHSMETPANCNWTL